MAIPWVIFDVDGLNTQFNIPFPFLRREHITAQIDGHFVNFNWINDTRIEITPPPSSGSQLTIRRLTPSLLLHQIQNGQPIPAKQHNELLQQVIYRSEEKETDSALLEMQHILQQATSAAAVATDAASAAQVAKQAAEVAAASATNIANFDPDTKLDKTGGAMTGTLFAGDANAIRFTADAGSPAVIARKDSSDFYFLLTQAGDGGGAWNDLRPFKINLDSGNVSFGHQVTVAGSYLSLSGGQYPFYNVAVPNGADAGGGLALVPAGGGKRSEVAYLAGGGVRIWIEGSGNVASFAPDGQAWFTSNVHVGGAVMHTNGNLVGSLWQNWGANNLYHAVENRIEARINARCVTDTRFEGFVQVVNGHLPAGYLATGNSVAGQIFGRQLQIYIPNIGWRAAGGW